MSIDIGSLTINEAREIAAMVAGFAPSPPSPAKFPHRVEGDGRAVIVRARDAGVHFGYLSAYEGRTVWLTQSRRLWKWKAISGLALSAVALNGLKADESKVDALVLSNIILDGCEIIDCSAIAIKTIEAA